jgi:hypothetical protein
MSRRIECGGMQGHGNPYATRRVMVREFDSLRARMQQPAPARSKWKRVLSFLLFAIVVMALYVVNVKGLK